MGSTTYEDYKAYEPVMIKEDFNEICEDALSGVQYERKYLSIIWNESWQSIRNKLIANGHCETEWYQRGIEQHSKNLFKDNE